MQAVPSPFPPRQELLLADLSVELLHFAGWADYIEGVELPEKFMQAIKILSFLQARLLKKSKNGIQNKEIQEELAKFSSKEKKFKQKLVEYLQKSFSSNNVTSDVQAIYDLFLKKLNTTAFLGKTYIHFVNELSPAKEKYIFFTVAEDNLEDKLQSLKKQIEYYFHIETGDHLRKLCFVDFVHGCQYQMSSLLKYSSAVSLLNEMLRSHNCKLKVTATEEHFTPIEKSPHSIVHAIEWCEVHTEVKHLVKFMPNLKNKISRVVSHFRHHDVKGESTQSNKKPDSKIQSQKKFV